MFKWISGSVPQNLAVKQVYGFVFTTDGRTLLRIEEKNDKEIFSLAGGRPEKFDKDFEATLRREFLEEVNTTLLTPIEVGYQLVDEKNGKPLYAQMRMIAIIDEIGALKPDPDNEETYKRFLTTPKKAKKLLKWGKSGRKMIKDCVRAARKHFGIKTHAKNDEFV